MATIVDITAWTVGSNPEDLATSNSGFTKNTVSGGSNLLYVTNSQSPYGVYPNTSVGQSTYAYIYNTSPATKTQTVTGRMHRITSATGPSIVLILRFIDANNWMGAQWTGDGSTFRYVKCIAGTLSFPGSYINTPVTMTTNGDYIDMEVTATHNGTNDTTLNARFAKNGGAFSNSGYGSISVTESALDANGKAGIWSYYTPGSTTQTAGQHLVRFKIEDATAGPPAITDVTASTTSAVVTYTSVATHYRLDGGSGIAIGSSPATITGLTENTEYTIEISSDNSNWYTPTDFGTENPITFNSGIGGSGGFRAKIGVGLGVGFS